MNRACRVHRYTSNPKLRKLCRRFLEKVDSGVRRIRRLSIEQELEYLGHEKLAEIEEICMSFF